MVQTEPTLDRNTFEVYWCVNKKQELLGAVKKVHNKWETFVSVANSSGELTDMPVSVFGRYSFTTRQQACQALVDYHQC